MQRDEKYYARIKLNFKHLLLELFETYTLEISFITTVQLTLLYGNEIELFYKKVLMQ